MGWGFLRRGRFFNVSMVVIVAAFTRGERENWIFLEIFILFCMEELRGREGCGEVGAALFLRSLSGFLRDLRGANRKPFARCEKEQRQPWRCVCPLMPPLAAFQVSGKTWAEGWRSAFAQGERRASDVAALQLVEARKRSSVSRTSGAKALRHTSRKTQENRGAPSHIHDSAGFASPDFLLHPSIAGK